jgi:hypothetical protein
VWECCDRCSDFVLIYLATERNPGAAKAAGL